MSFDIYSARTAHITAMIAPIASQGQTYCIRLLWSGSFAIPKVPVVVGGTCNRGRRQRQGELAVLVGALERSAGTNAISRRVFCALDENHRGAPHDHGDLGQAGPRWRPLISIGAADNTDDSG